ncbi:unnamed protein product [Dicrocoelium dendriticum]|nr:unnamed protein product [Dicrocoelium dendriticum]
MPESQDFSKCSMSTGTLIQGTGTDIPRNGFLLPSNTVYDLRKSKLRASKKFEVWPLIYGTGIGTAVVLLSSFVIHINARQLFHLYTRSHFWSTLYAPVLFSGALYWISFEGLITRRVLTRTSFDVEGYGDCDLCLEVRGSLIQCKHMEGEKTNKH